MYVVGVFLFFFFVFGVFWGFLFLCLFKGYRWVIVGRVVFY